MTRTVSTTRSTRPVLLVAAATAVGGFLFGFDNGSISGAAGDLTTKYDLSPAGIGFVTSSLILGGIVGVLIAGRLSDAIGRKRVLAGVAFIFLIGAIGEALAPSPGWLIAARIVVGLGIGTEVTIAPLYIAEIAPANLRGRLVSFNQLFNTIGSLVVFIVAAIIANVGSAAFNVDFGWRIIFGTGVIPALVFVLTLRFLPESPRWLVRNGRADDALHVIERLQASDDPEAELADVQNAVAAERKVGISALWQPGLRKALVVGFGVALFGQITGINAIFYYAPEIFKNAGFGAGAASSSTVLIGVVLLLSTLVSVWIIDKIGRRTLLVIGSIGMAVFLGAIGVLFATPHPSAVLLIVLVLAYVAVYALSFGTVSYVIIAEIFPTQVRGLAASIATVALFGGNYFVSQFFPILVAGAGSSITFYIFAAVALLALVFVATLVPETRNRTLEDIEETVTGSVRAVGPRPTTRRD